MYLGNTFIFGQSKSKKFGILKNIVQCKIESWQNTILLKAGKAPLIKSVVQAIPTYTMSTSLLPKQI